MVRILNRWPLVISVTVVAAANVFPLAAHPHKTSVVDARLTSITIR